MGRRRPEAAMFRYRCPNPACGRILAAPPIRAGRPSVCPGCARPLTIPADSRDWLPDPPEPAAVLAAVGAGFAASPAGPPELFPPSEPELDLFAPIRADADPATARLPAPTPHPWVPAPSDPDPPGPLWEPSPVETTLPLADEATPAPPPLPAPDADTPQPPGPLVAADPTPTPASPDRPAPADPVEPAELAAALAGRLRPSPRPGGDLRPATALWLLLVGAGAVLLGLTLCTPADLAGPAVYLGAGLVEVGYLWAVWRAFRRRPIDGLACAVPPLTFGYLLRRKYGDAQPLRFVAAGAVLAGLGWVAPAAAPITRGWVGAGDARPAVSDPPKPPSVAERLREYAARRADDRLAELLRELTRTDPATAPDRAEVTAEIERLYRHPAAEVRAQAMAADVAWGGVAARARVLAAVGGADRDDRLAALRLLPHWKDDEAARAAAGRVGKGNVEGSVARQVLIEIGGPAAERAALPLLKADEQGVRLAAIDLLADERGRVGGPAAAAELTALAETSPDPGTRLAAAAAAERMGGRK